MSKRNVNLGLDYGEGIGYVPFEEDRFLKQMIIKESFENSNWRKYITNWHTIQKHRGNKIEVTVVEPARRRFFSMFKANEKQIVLDSEKAFAKFGILPSQILKRDVYKEFILPEGSSGEKAYIGAGGVRRIEKGVLPIGAWTTYTEEYELFATAELPYEIMRQYGEINAMIMDSYYRDAIFYGAGYRINLLEYENGYNSVHSPILNQVLKNLTSRMKKYGAREIGKIMSSSMDYGVVPIQTNYVMKVPYDAGVEFERNPKFVGVENYVSMTRIYDDEIGAIGNVRIVKDADMSIREVNGRAVIDALIISQSPIDGLRVDGEKDTQLIHIPVNTNDKSDKLKRFGVIGFKSWLGSIDMHPERTAVVTMYLDSMGIQDLIDYSKKCGNDCLVPCTDEPNFEDQNHCTNNYPKC